MKNISKIIFLGLIILVIPVVACYASDVKIFPPPQDAKAAPDYKIKVNGEDVFVYNSSYNPFAIFNFTGKAEVEISTENDLKWVNIRPLRDSVQWKINGNNITFTLDHPCNLSIEFNNEKSRALFVFAGDMKEPDTGPGNVIRYAGGKSYNAGTIELKSNDVLVIEGGAIVHGNIKAENAENIKIIGSGILDGSVSMTIPPARMISLKDCRHVLIDGIVIHNSPTWTIVPTHCYDLVINNVKQVNWKNGSDGIDLVSTSQVKITGCFLKNNDDCIVIKSFNPEKNYPDSLPNKGMNVKDITVDHCTLWNMPWGNALEIGFELRCDSVSHITFSNINIIHVERGAAISIHNGDFASVTDITYENINIEDADHKLIDLAIFLSQYSIDKPSSGEDRNSRYMNGAWDGVLKVYEGESPIYAKNRGYINHILFKNVRVVEGPFPFSILYGFDNTHIVSNIVFDNLTILNKRIAGPEEGHFFISHAENITFK